MDSSSVLAAGQQGLWVLLMVSAPVLASEPRDWRRRR